MYQSPIPVNENKQCCDCKYYDYGGDFDLSTCDMRQGYGEYNAVEAFGTCEKWELQEDEDETQNT